MDIKGVFYLLDTKCNNESLEKKLEQIQEMNMEEKTVVKYAAEKLMECEHKNISIYYATAPLVTTIALIGVNFATENYESFPGWAKTCVIVLILCILAITVACFVFSIKSARTYDKYLRKAVACCLPATSEAEQVVTVKTKEETIVQSVKKN